MFCYLVYNTVTCVNLQLQKSPPSPPFSKEGKRGFDFNEEPFSKLQAIESKVNGETTCPPADTKIF